MYFDVVPNRRVETYSAIVQMSYQFAGNPSEDTFTTLNDNFLIVKKTVDEGERGFIETMFNFIKETDPNASSWQIYKNDPQKRRKVLSQIRTEETSLAIASGFVVMAALKLRESGYDIQITESKIRKIGAVVATVFPELVALFKNVWRIS